MSVERFDPFAKPEHIKLTGRARALETLARVYDGKQYDGRPDWWTGQHGGRSDGDRAPLRERKPCIVSKLPRSAVQQVVQFLFGDGRFPQVNVPVLDGDQALAGITISDDDSELLQTWIAEFVDRAKVKPRIRAIAKSAIACKTAIAILGLRDGRFTLKTPKAQHCWAQFRHDDPDDEVIAFVWCYEYEAEVQDHEGKPRTARFIFREQWDETNHYSWDDVQVEVGKPIEWGPVNAQPHGFSFCPVLWIRNDCEHADGIDGRSLYEDDLAEVEALDFTLSQRHRGLAYLGTPQPYETGVEDGDGPGQGGHTAATPGYSANDTTWNVAAPARKMSPDEIWRYEGKEVTLGLLETSGKAFEVATNHAKLQRANLLERWSVVLASEADTLSGRVTAGAEMSARFLALSYAPLLALCNEYRHTWWIYGLSRLIGMALRMVAELNGEGILVPGTEKIVPVLKRFLTVDIGSGELRWIPPKLDPAWGDYFDPSPSETSAMVDGAQKAKDAGLIAKATALQYVAPAFDVENVEAELEEIEEEKAEAMAQAQAQMTAEAEAFHAAAKVTDDNSPNPPRGGPGAGAQPSRNARQRRRSAAAAKATSKAGAAQPPTDGR